MEENKNLVLDGTENVEEHTTEETVEQVETPKTYTQEEVDQIVGKRLARNTAKIRKEFEGRYGELDNVLQAGTGKENMSEIADDFRKFYESKGLQIPKKPTYSDRDVQVLAKTDAEDIIGAGYEEVVEETDRLARLGNSMTPRERETFRQLAQYRKNAERGRELAKIGVTEDVYGSQAFKDFSAKFSPDTPVKEIYEIYNKLQPKKEVQTMGSMANSIPEGTIKEFYTKDEAMKFTTKDFDKNPELFKAVKKSMQKW